MINNWLPAMLPLALGTMQPLPVPAGNAVPLQVTPV
jgi:hypothetical protein